MITTAINTVEIPFVDEKYVPFGEYKTMENIIKSKMFYPVFVFGHTGAGKTKMVEQACAKTKRPLIRVNLSTNVDETDILGGPTLVDGNVVFQDGPILTAMKTGSVLLLDEVDRAEQSKILCILSILEGAPYYNKRTGETIVPKEGFQIIATANTQGSGSESGHYLAQIMDQAFLERFGITIEQEYPDMKTETKILQKVLDDADFIANLVRWSNVIRQTWEQNGIDDFISTRRLVHIAKAYSIFGNKKKAIELCVSRFNSDVKDAFIDLYNKIDAGEMVGDEQPEESVVESDD